MDQTSSSQHHDSASDVMSDEGLESGVITASCSYRQPADPLTTTAECMTREYFVFYRDQHVNANIEGFLEEIRNAILTQSEKGEFFKLGISPAVLSDDWVLRATEFVRYIEENPVVQLSLRIREKPKRHFKEGWFEIQCTGRQALPLAFFSKKEPTNGALLGCLDALIKAVRLVLTARFPQNPLAPLQRASRLWDAATPANVDRVKVNVHDALEKVKALKADGLSTVQIKQEMQKYRESQKAKLTNLSGKLGTTSSSKAAAAADEKNQPATEETFLVKETEKDWVIVKGKNPALGSYKSFDYYGYWKGALAIAAVCFIYVYMRGA